jgi:UDP-N-acetylmuramoyl-L-alanyl-D-glutamate--2,6-diaminopimelate ligase
MERGRTPSIPRAARAALVARMRAPPPPPAWAESLLSVGVTGTNGKTSTAGFIAGLLGLVARPVARVTTLGCFLDDERLDVPAHYEGFVQTLERCLRAGGRYAALELTSEALALGFAKAWPCRIGVFTNLSHDHSDAHGTVEHYLASKAQLFMALPPGGTAVLNARDEAALLLRDVLGPEVDVVSYGVASRGDAWTPPDLVAEQIELSWRGTRALLAPSLRFPGLPRQVELPAIGEIFVENALAALGAAAAAAVPLQKAVARLAQLPPPAGRFQLVRERPYVVVDYAHTPDALARTLETARALCRAEVTLVFGAGGDRDPAKRPLLGAAARAADHIVLTSDNPRSEDPMAIMAAVAAGIGEPRNLTQEPDRARAIQLAIERAKPDDLVLIVGKGHELTQEAQGLRVPFSDVAIVMQARTTAR